MLRLTTADLMEALRGKDIFDPRKVSYAVIETNGTLSAALRPEQEAATLSDLQLKVQQTQATIPFVLDGQVLEDNLRWCGKDRAWLERTATANTVLPQEILLLIGNETEDYFLLKKEGCRALHRISQPTWTVPLRLYGRRTFPPRGRRLPRVRSCATPCGRL